MGKEKQIEREKKERNEVRGKKDGAREKGIKCQQDGIFGKKKKVYETMLSRWLVTMSFSSPEVLFYHASFYCSFTKHCCIQYRMSQKTFEY